MERKLVRLATPEDGRLSQSNVLKIFGLFPLTVGKKTYPNATTEVTYGYPEQESLWGLRFAEIHNTALAVDDDIVFFNFHAGTRERLIDVLDNHCVRYEVLNAELKRVGFLGGVDPALTQLDGSSTGVIRVLMPKTNSSEWYNGKIEITAVFEFGQGEHPICAMRVSYSRSVPFVQPEASPGH